MKSRRDDVRNIALISGAGLVGVLATVLVMVATQGPAVAPGEMAVGEGQGMDRAAQVEEARVRVSGTMRIGAPGGLAPLILGSRGLPGEPIVYIDGVRLDRSTDVRDLVNPDRIDRIEVIKGPAAKKAFGNEAEDGVIQIFLKPDQESEKKESGSGR